MGFLDLSLSKKIARRSILFYMCTTISAVILGIILVLLIRPGAGAADIGEEEKRRHSVARRNVLTQDTLLDLIRFEFLNACELNVVRIVVACAHYSNEKETCPHSQRVSNSATLPYLILYQLEPDIL